MPRVRRRAKLRRETGYTDDHIHQLLSGFDFGDAFGNEHRGELDLDAMRLAWESLRDELLPKWIDEHPGTRPYAWWVFDAPERRQRVDGVPHPFDNPERKTKCEQWRRQYPDVADRSAYKLWFGKPTTLIVRDDFDAEYEVERDYLDRLYLLTVDERSAMIDYGLTP